MIGRQFRSKKDKLGTNIGKTQKKGALFRTSGAYEPEGQGSQAVSETLFIRKRVFCLSFPMFVPSLSW